MAAHERIGKSDEWYTPKYIFEAMGYCMPGCSFDMDVAAPRDLTHVSVPAKEFIVQGGLEAEWHGHVWMNAPFGGRMGLVPWLDKFFAHNNGVALTPDRTSA